ncbi:pyrimidine reductase family protein [Tomitella biformata]|uniref:pyrimidine reductase family protein n=1 Tax=Tomitella biformata TaxID=630403 RepID=UPI00046433E6|nr:pyrimidine reductase family protein [Tomitella biformata]
MRRLDNATDLTFADSVSMDQLHHLYAYPADGRPWLRVNFVSTLDGAISAGGRSGALGGPGDRLVFGTLRDLADVVLVGAGTVRTEGYGGVKVSAAQRERRVQDGQGPVPPIAIVTASAKLDPQSRVFAEAEAPTIVFTSASASEADVAALAAAGAVVHRADSARVDLSAVLASLTAQGLGRVLCEGGPRLFGDILEHDAVDELCLTISPLLTAGDSPRIAVSGRSVFHRMRQAHLLQDDDGSLLGRWVRDRATT